jgi:hypothetical protein
MGNELLKAYCVFALLIAALVSSGCESRLDQNYRLSDPQRGLVLVRIVDITAIPDEATLYIQQYDPGSGALLARGRFTKDAEHWEYFRLKNGFSHLTQGSNGGFFVTEAAQGSYFVERLAITAGRRTNNMCLKGETVAFDVKPGTITYIGDYTVSPQGLKFAGIHQDEAQAEIAIRPNIASLAFNAPLMLARVDGTFQAAGQCYADGARLVVSRSIASLMAARAAGPLNIFASNSFISIADPTVPESGSPKERGDKLVNSTGLKGVFENITTGPVTTVRHIPSGLVCNDPSVVLSPKEPAKLFDPAKQAGCISRAAGVQNNLMVIANSGSISASEALKALTEHEQSVQHNLELDGAGGDPAPKAKSAFANLVSVANSPPRFVHIAVATVKHWVVMDEATCAPASAADCERTADEAINRAIAEVR